MPTKTKTTDKDTPVTALETLGDFAQTAVETDDLHVQRNRVSKFADNPFRKAVAHSLASGKTLKISCPGRLVPDAVAFLRAAARDEKHGIRIHHKPDYTQAETVVIRFLSRPLKARTVASKVPCLVCQKNTTITADGMLRVHGPQTDRCKGSAQPVTFTG